MIDWLSWGQTQQWLNLEQRKHKLCLSSQLVTVTMDQHRDFTGVTKTQSSTRSPWYHLYQIKRSILQWGSHNNKLQVKGNLAINVVNRCLASDWLCPPMLTSYTKKTAILYHSLVSRSLILRNGALTECSCSFVLMPLPRGKVSGNSLKYSSLSLTSTWHTRGQQRWEQVCRGIISAERWLNQAGILDSA